MHLSCAPDDTPCANRTHSGLRVVRIGIVTSSISRRGAGLFESVRSLSCALASHGAHTVEVFGLHDPHTNTDVQQWQPIRPVTFAARGPHRFGYAPDLRKALERGNLDLVHSHGLWMYPSYASHCWRRQSKRPTIVSLHGMLDPTALQISVYRKRFARWLFEDEHLQKADCLHALSQHEAVSIRQFGLRNPICVIPNGIELPPEQELVKQCPSGSRKTLLYLGRLHPIKNLVGLLQAWHRLSKRRPDLRQDWRLVVAGWSQRAHGERLAQLCTSHGLSDSVSLVGPQFGADKARLYRESDAFVLPSLNEALPMAVLEAWSYGLPVAMTAACHLPIGYEAGAAQAIATDPDNMSHGLQSFLEMTDDERLAMGEKGRQLVRARFVWSQIAENMSQVYDWLVGIGTQPPCIVFK